MEIVYHIFRYYNYFMVSYFLVLSTLYLILNIASFLVIRRYAARIEHIELKNLFRFSNIKPISVVVPAYNKGNAIIDSTYAFLHRISR
jgi:hypothetical protein